MTDKESETGCSSPDEIPSGGVSSQMQKYVTMSHTLGEKFPETETNLEHDMVW